MRRIYENPEITITSFSSEDVITASGPIDTGGGSQDANSMKSITIDTLQ